MYVSEYNKKFELGGIAQGHRWNMSQKVKVKLFFAHVVKAYRGSRGRAPQ